MGAPTDLESGPRVLDDVHARARNARPGREEVLDEPPSERLDVIDRMLLGQRVDRVAHGVGGKQAGVVSLDVGGLEVALELDVDREIAQVVAVGPARDLDEANLGLPVPGLTQNDRHPSAPSICAVSKRAEQQRHVVVLLAVPRRRRSPTLRGRSPPRQPRGNRRRCRRSAGSAHLSERDESRSRARPSASVVPRPTGCQPASTARSSTTGTPAAGRPRAVSSTCVVIPLKIASSRRSARRSRAIFAISPSAISISSSRECSSRAVPQARIDVLGVLAHADDQREPESLPVGSGSGAGALSSSSAVRRSSPAEACSREDSPVSVRSCASRPASSGWERPSSRSARCTTVPPRDRLGKRGGIGKAATRCQHARGHTRAGLTREMGRPSCLSPISGLVRSLGPAPRPIVGFWRRQRSSSPSTCRRGDHGARGSRRTRAIARAAAPASRRHDGRRAECCVTVSPIGRAQSVADGLTHGEQRRVDTGPLRADGVVAVVGVLASRVGRRVRRRRLSARAARRVRRARASSAR